MGQMLFEIVEGKLRCRLPRRIDGSMREADGRILLDLKQAAAFSGRSEADLRAEYLATFEDLADDQQDDQAERNPHNGENAQSEVTEYNCQIWECQFPNRINAGLMVTEPGRVDSPIAFVPIVDVDPDEADISQAELIVEHRDRLSMVLEPDRAIIDLRPYGKLDSNAPMPRWIYSLRCRPQGSKAEYTHVPTPFCRFLIQEMMRVKAQL